MYLEGSSYGILKQTNYPLLCLETLRNGLCVETLRNSTKTCHIQRPGPHFDHGTSLIHVRNVRTWADLLDVAFIKFLKVHSYILSAICRPFKAGFCLGNTCCILIGIQTFKILTASYTVSSKSESIITLRHNDLCKVNVIARSSKYTDRYIPAITLLL